MKSKTILMINIIKSIIIILVLFLIFFRSLGIAKVMVVPFIFGGFFLMGKDICLLMNRAKYAHVFQKLFLISFLVFWFGTLEFWSYLVIRQNHYFLLLFTIPFLLIGIFIIHKYF